MGEVRSANRAKWAVGEGAAATQAPAAAVAHVPGAGDVSELVRFPLWRGCVGMCKACEERQEPSPVARHLLLPPTAYRGPILSYHHMIARMMQSNA